MASFQQDKSDQARQTAHLEESSAQIVHNENLKDFGDDPKHGAEESGLSYTKEEEGEALKRLDWNLIPL